MSVVKKGLIYFVAIVAIIVGIIASIPGFLNWNEYKTEVTDTIYSQTGHRINIGGNLVVRLLPSPALAAGDITLLDPTGAPFLKLDSLGINVGFIALVMGRIEAKSLVLKGGVLTLERNADGIANWQFLLPEENEATPSNADDMRFDHVSIDDLEVHYNDAVLGRTDVFKNIDAVLRADSAKGPFSINSSYSYGGVGFELEATSGRIETSRSFPLSLNLIVAGQNPGINFQATVVLDGAASAASGQFKAAGGNLGEVAAGLMLLANGTEPDEFPLNLDK
ncbi:MAG: AsmA family protein, partial [Sphingomonadales bacterium]|nr:AsmA family protein [Sphingomonadales bacterium]